MSMGHSKRVAKRGAVLAVVVGVAIVAAIAAYAILLMVLAQGRHARFYRERLRARYAAEAGIVWAQQRLWRDPTYCGSPGPPAIEGLAVTVTISDCTAGSAKVIAAQATY